ncbi:hypothetical protein C8A01DRAFT_40704 [Parachaetomium inaequale]|uniref:Uncharacterized protein n=1 Tax=Parachaetomium inaequale TaxID=2588326 RepID=A0AAN6P6V8_9PEZI|nr:hypothetical protein C8A01DRAFT_40704 [Parachaetomium inaequale]
MAQHETTTKNSTRLPTLIYDGVACSRQDAATTRIEHIMRMFKKSGLGFTGSGADLIPVVQTEPNKYMWRLPARQATREEICTVHHPAHFVWVKALSNKTTQELGELSERMDQGRDSIYVGGTTYGASLISAGAIETCVLV